MNKKHLKKKGRKGKINNKKSMKQLSDVIVEVQALSTVTEDQFEAALATAITDLQALSTNATPGTGSDPITSVVVTQQSGWITTLTQ
jgi:hypothetical protein